MPKSKWEKKKPKTQPESLLLCSKSDQIDETAKEEKLKFGQKNAVKRCLVLTVFEPHVHDLIPDGTFPPDVFHTSIWGGAHRKSLFRADPLKEVLKRLDEPSVCRIKSRPIRFFYFLLDQLATAQGFLLVRAPKLEPRCSAVSNETLAKPVLFFPFPSMPKYHPVLIKRLRECL